MKKVVQIRKKEKKSAKMRQWYRYTQFVRCTQGKRLYTEVGEGVRGCEDPCFPFNTHAY